MRPFAWAVGAALALRFVLAAVLVGTDLVDHNGWYFPNDDQMQYYGFAEGLTQGELPAVYPTIGYDLFLVPFASVYDFVLQAIPAVAAVQLALTLAAAWVLYRAGARLLDERAAALGTALWLALPLLLGPLFVPSVSFWNGAAPQWLGLEISVDFFSTLLAIAALGLVAGARDDGGIPRGLLLGAVCGFAMLTKPSNVVIALAAAAALLAWGRRRTLLAALPTAVALGLPQLVYNDRLFGAPHRFAYSPSVAERYIGNRGLEGGEFSPLTRPRAYGKLVLSNFTGPLLLLAVAVALVVAWRRFPHARWAVVGQALGFAVLLGMYRYSVGNHFVRLLMPALPAVCLAAGSALVGRAGREVRDGGRAGPVAAGVAVAAVAGALALSIWIAGAPAASELNVVDELAPRAEVRDGAVRLDWPELDALATLRYEVRRTRRAPARGFAWGLVPPQAPTIPAGERTEAADLPPPGTWWYRVAVVPTRDREGREPGPPTAWSPAVRVVVR